jgi:hypothetical protein
MISDDHAEEDEEPSPEEEGDEQEAPPKRGPVNHYALASLLIGSLALIWVSIPILKILPLILGALGLFTGILGLAAYSHLRKGKIWSITGLSASLLASSLCAIGLIRAGSYKPTENRLTQIPLHNPIPLADSRGTPEVDSEWVDASKNAVQQGDVRVRLVSITVCPVDFVEAPGAAKSPKGTSPTTGQKKPREKYVVINLRISNAGAGQLIQYTSWSHPSATTNLHPVELQDASGKKYPLKVFPAGKDVVGQVANASIPPTKWADDVLVFERVPDRVEFLRLELPGESVGSKSSFHLQIPGRMIAFR